MAVVHRPVILFLLSLLCSSMGFCSALLLFLLFAATILVDLMMSSNLWFGLKKNFYLVN